jgi:putative copper export protein
LVASFCALGLIIVILEFVLFYRARERVSANEIMRTFSTTLILIAVVALLGIGYNQTQVQPALGLFGTLLGYLMGRGEAFQSAKADTSPREIQSTRESKD